jgi:hypothetical protein
VQPSSGGYGSGLAVAIGRSSSERAAGSAEAGASADAVGRVVTSMGGANRYFYLNGIWTLRQALDWLVAGSGFTRGRRDPVNARLRDTIDDWSVIGVEPERRLTSHFGLRAPGSGLLQFQFEPLPDGGTRLTETAYWHPQGVWGLLY